MCDWNDTVEMEMPEWVNPERKNRMLSIDRCIAPTVRALWDAKCQTLGCCCGHGRHCPELVIPSHGDPEKTLEILRQDGARRWNVLQWQLVKVETT